MKKLLSLLLPLALLLSLTACGEKSADEAARQTPPTLTVTSANACSVTLKSSSYDWTYTQGLQSMTAIACGAHPLDETSRDITPVLEMPFAVSAAYFYTVTLDFGDNSPDSVSLRCWPSDAWGSTGMPSETVTAQRQDNGTFRAELPQSDGIFAVDALWDGSSATYTFCTQAEEIETTSGNAGVVDGTWGKIELSTVSGAIELAGEAENAEIETASGKVDIAGALGALNFESVSGNLILATERALRLDAETESGSIYLTLPAQDGFTLDYETKSGAFRSALTEREGTLIVCGDHEAYYTVPALEGGEMSELEISTVSGTLTINASSGSN